MLETDKRAVWRLQNRQQIRQIQRAQILPVTQSATSPRHTDAYPRISEQPAIAPKNLPYRINLEITRMLWKRRSIASKLLRQ